MLRPRSRSTRHSEVRQRLLIDESRSLGTEQQREPLHRRARVDGGLKERRPPPRRMRAAGRGPLGEDLHRVAARATPPPPARPSRGSARGRDRSTKIVPAGAGQPPDHRPRRRPRSWPPSAAARRRPAPSSPRCPARTRGCRPAARPAGRGRRSRSSRMPSARSRRPRHAGSPAVAGAAPPAQQQRRPAARQRTADCGRERTATTLGAARCGPRPGRGCTRRTGTVRAATAHVAVTSAGSA